MLISVGVVLQVIKQYGSSWDENDKALEGVLEAVPSADRCEVFGGGGVTLLNHSSGKMVRDITLWR